MSVDALLSRLDGVKKTGNGRWLARAPTREDKTPSVAIRELPDGRVLVHDFGGDSTGEILDAVGLTFADLFAEPLGQHLPRERRPFSASDVLSALSNEAHVVLLCARDAASGKAPNHERLLLAVERIGRAIEESGHAAM